MDRDKLKPKLLTRSAIEEVDLLSLLENATSGIWYWRVDRNEVFWSPGLAKTMGYDLDGDDDIPNIFDQIYPEDTERHERAIAESRESAASYHAEIRMVRSDGTTIWLATSGLWQQRPGEEPHAMIGFVRNISERIRTTEALAASEARFRGFFDQVPAAVFIKDETGRHLYGNEAAAAIAGTDLDHFIDATVYDLFDKDSAEALAAADRDTLERNETVTWVGPLHVPGDRAERYVWDTKFPLQGQGERRLLGGVGIDITALHETQKQLAVAQRLESMGLMASGVAHDFNNLLFAIAGNAELALPHVAPEHRALVQSILAATEHASALCRQLLAVGGRADAEAKPVAVGDFVRGSVELLEMALQGQHKLELKIDCDGGSARIDTAQLRQVLVNLVLNAKAASEPGATITVGCETVELGLVSAESAPETHSWLPAGASRGVCLYVEDHGRGMSRDVVERIFEPYYTDSELGHGLGLATVFGIVKAARGALRVDSTPGEGSRFEVYLRCETRGGDAPPSSDRQSGEAAASAAGIRRIMVVDDHAEIVAIVVAWLERLGIETTSYTSSLLAVDVLRTRHAEFDAVLTDISMPDIGGIGVLQAVRERDPDKPVILASGYNDRAFQVDDDPRVWFLQKPYSLAELQRVLAEIDAPAD